MEKQLKLVDYSDSESEKEDENTPTSQGFTGSIRDDQGRPVGIITPTPQAQEIESDFSDELEEAGLLETEQFPDPTDGRPPNSPTYDQSSNQPNSASEDLSTSFGFEVARDNPEIILISDSSQGTIILSPVRNNDDHLSATTGN